MFSDYLFDTFSGYTGTAGDPLAGSNGMKFRTKDRDNDNWSGGQCAAGGWWYSSNCVYSGLNGIYLGSSYRDRKRVVWYHAYMDTRVFKRAVMKIRPV